MSPLEQKAFGAYARTQAFQRKKERTQTLIDQVYRDGHRPYVAYSGGKDSTALLWLIRSVFPQAPAVFSDDEWHLPETLTHLAQVPNLHRVASTHQHADWFVSWADARPADAQWYAGVDNPMGAWARERGCDVAMIGLRAEENSARRIHIAHFGQFFWAQKHEIFLCYPLAWWSVREIWTLIVSEHIPYNAAYDKMNEMGIPRDRQRVGPLAVERALGYGQLAIVQRGWPALFNQFAERFPEARSYV